MAKALGLMRAMGWDYRQAEGNIWVASDIRRQIGLEEAPSRMTLWRAERRFSEEWLREFNARVLEEFKKNSATLVNEKEVPPFTRNEGWSERVADVKTMGLGPRS